MNARNAMSTTGFAGITAYQRPNANAIATSLANPAH
jgi:hypothetical protein